MLFLSTWDNRHSRLERSLKDFPGLDTSDFVTWDGDLQIGIQFGRSGGGTVGFYIAFSWFG